MAEPTHDPDDRTNGGGLPRPSTKEAAAHG